MIFLYKQIFHILKSNHIPIYLYTVQYYYYNIKMVASVKLLIFLGSYTSTLAVLFNIFCENVLMTYTKIN